MREPVRAWQETNKYANNRAYQARLLARIREQYGTECLSCGYDADVRAIQIDHVAGGGRRERMKYGSAQRRLLIANGVTSGLYQALCANCNAIKHSEGQ